MPRDGKFDVVVAEVAGSQLIEMVEKASARTRRGISGSRGRAEGPGRWRSGEEGDKMHEKVESPYLAGWETTSTICCAKEGRTRQTGQSRRRTCRSQGSESVSAQPRPSTAIRNPTLQMSSRSCSSAQHRQRPSNPSQPLVDSSCVPRVFPMLLSGLPSV